MGGTVSSGRSNDELVDNLIDAEFLKTTSLHQVFRAVDRGNYYHPAHKENAYKDVAWKMGNLHLSAPCVYSVVMEALKLKPGYSFLNLGSGSGYLSTMAGLILGRYGVNHGIELHEDIVEYAYEKLEEFIKNSKVLDEYDFCEPVFTTGNCLMLEHNSQQYDRVYCGAACPKEYESYVKNLVKVDGILVMPLNDKLLKITRVTEDQWSAAKILSVSFAPLVVPPPGAEVVHSKLSDITPPNLQQICRFAIRSTLRQNVDIEHPKLKKKHVFNESRPIRQVRRFVIPFFEESDFSNSQSDSDVEYDSDSVEYTISSRLPSRMSVFLEDFLRRHAELQILRQMEQENSSQSSSTDSDFTLSPSESPAKRVESPARRVESPARRVETPARRVDSAAMASSLIPTGSLHLLPRNTKPMVTYSTSDESDTNFDKPPSQSTRSKKQRKNAKRKKTAISTRRKSPRLSNAKRKSTASSSAEPKRKLRRTAATVVWKQTDEKKKAAASAAKAEDAIEGTSDLSYADYMVQKIESLPLPPFLLKYLNYRRANL